MNRRAALILAAVMAGSAVLAACGNSGTTSTTGGQPVYGGTLITTFKDDFKSLDPAIGYDTDSWSIERALYNGLLDYKGYTTQLVPDIASAMPKISADGKTYTFTLRHDVKFSNGRGVTAGDFKYSWERMLDPKTAGPMTGGPFWGSVTGAQDFFNGKTTSVSGIKAIDPYTLEIDLDTPNLAFSNILAMPFAFVIPKEAVDAANGDFAHHPIGTGAFTLASYTPGQLLVLKRNPTYFGARPYLDEVDAQIGVSTDVAYLRMQNGQVDLPQPDVSMPSSNYIQLNGDPRWSSRIVRQPNVDIWYISMNVNMKPFDNVKVRQAFNLIINKANLVKILNGRAVINNGIQAPPMPGFVSGYNPLGLDSNGQNLTKAKQLLQQAGYDASHPFPAQDFLYANTTPDADRESASMQQDFKQAGITLNLKGLAFASFLDLVGKPNTVALSWTGWIQDFPDPSDFIDPLLTCASANVTANGTNNPFYCNKTVDQLADKARGDTNTTERLTLYRQIQDIVAAQDFPEVPMYSTVETSISSTRTHGYQIHPVWPLVLTTLWVSGAASSAPAASASASATSS
ncbi:MAG TPA: ABC transporter substrate-binding protein [Candidatus Limnocylindrales bacterium]|nr:ABC transporter substrate-binding protein [Candidatus Limnocylindrales bacterium]